MAASVSSHNWVRIYKALQREASNFPQYSYRHFAKRRIRDYFVANRDVEQARAVELYKDAQRALKSLQRQTAVSGVYPYHPLVIEATSPAFLKRKELS